MARVPADDGTTRAIVGPDNEPMRFPLHLTRDQLADLCGADTYRVYALDEVGGVLDYVTTVTAGLRPRNAAPDMPAFALASVPAAAAPPITDMRYALETIAHVARTNAEAMRAIAESQADWIKTIAAAKGLPRNLPPVPVLPPANDRDDEGNDDLDDDPAPPERESGIEAVLRQVAPYVPGLTADWRGKTKASNSDGATAMAHLVKIQARLSSDERALLAALLDDPETGAAMASDFTSKPVDEVVALIRRGAPSRHATPTTEQLVREKLAGRDASPVLAATVTVLGHPEFGQTRTRLDGAYDLVVNGGSNLTVVVSKSGFLPAQRTVDVPWEDYVAMPDWSGPTPPARRSISRLPA